MPTMTINPETAALLGIKSRVVRDRDEKASTAYDASAVLDLLTAKGIKRTSEYVDGSLWIRRNLPLGAVTPPETATRNRILNTGETLPGSFIITTLKDVTPLRAHK